MSLMEFEPIEPELEAALADIVAKVDDFTGDAEDVVFRTPEFRALEEMGFFSEVHKYIDGTCSVKPTYAALKYADRKEEWKKSRIAGAAKGIGEKAVDKGLDFAAKVASNMLGQ